MISSVPIYDYRCDHCGHAFSAVQSFHDGPVETCPSCGKRPRRLLSSPAIVFKGSGWYKTDSRTAPKGESDGPKAETKTDAKTDGKTDTKATSDAKTGSTTAPTKAEGTSSTR